MIGTRPTRPWEEIHVGSIITGLLLPEPVEVLAIVLMGEYP